jgi:alpha-tubulin suppressor-like RCC1 family protein
MRFVTARLATAATAAFLAIGSGVVASAATPAGGTTSIVLPGPVTAAAVTAVTSNSLTLEWTNPSAGFTGVVIRRAKGTVAPGFANGTLVATTAAGATSFTNTGLAPGTEYTYALFALGAGGSPAAADIVTGQTNANLSITTEALPEGAAGLAYQAVLAASGGAEPYTWTASGLPAGLSMSPHGIITGYPAAVGTSNVIVTVTDAAHATRTAPLKLEVPVALPAGCAAQSCVQLSPDGDTVQVPAADVAGVTRDPVTNAVTQVLLTGISVASGEVLVLAPVTGIPSGLIAVAGTVTDNGDGTATVAVTIATPADAYDSGVVQVMGAGITTTTADVQGSGTAQVLGTGTKIGSGAAAPAPAPSASLLAAGTPAPGAPSPLSCSGGVSSSLLGLSVTHTLTPSLTAIWKHPYFGGGGVYIGTGGLSLFQFDLDGTIALNMGIAVSGAATCTLTLPELKASLPAGDLGAVIFATTPELTFTVTGAIDMRSTVSLNCGAEYRWFNGTESRIAYCEPSSTPLQLSAGSGLDATLKGTLGASVTLDDIAGITGDIWAQAHAGYHPAQHPEAELDASAGWDLGACLACFWKGSPATVTIGSGTFFSKTLATYDTAPAGTPPVITSTSFPDATAGQSYTAALTTADQRAGTWQITGGALPPGLSLSGSAINGTPTTAGTYPFTLTFTDTSNQTTQAAVTLTVDNSGSGSSPPPQPLTCGSLTTTCTAGWGYDYYGELGDGTVYNGQTLPVRGQLLDGATSLAEGEDFTLAIMPDGTVQAVGHNQDGQLGNGTRIDSSTPVAVSGLTGVTAVAAGRDYSLALKSDGTVWAWGYNDSGGMGIGGFGYQTSIPQQIPGLTGVKAISADATFFTSVALLNDGAVWAFGGNLYGFSPVQIAGLSDVVAITNAGDNVLALKSDGTVWGIGDNQYGQLGNGTTTSSSTPVQVQGLTNVIQISAEGYDAYALKGDGTVWSWGNNQFGQLGDGTNTDSSIPVQVADLTRVKLIAAGASYALALRTDGTVWAWGSNETGQLGNGAQLGQGTTTNSSIPVEVLGLSGVTYVQAGADSCLAFYN